MMIKKDEIFWNNKSEKSYNMQRIDSRKQEFITKRRSRSFRMMASMKNSSLNEES